MFTNGGIAVDSWVKVDEGCPIAVEVVGDEAQFVFGGRRGGELTMIITEEGLEKVVEHFQRALDRLQATDPTDPADPADSGSGGSGSTDLGELRAE